MQNKLERLILVVILTVSIQYALPAQAVKNSRKPNIVFFLVDDLGWSDLEVWGTSFYETPNLKKLAAESVLFTNAYAASPVCSPTRASLLTGKYPSRIHTTNFFGAPQPEDFSKNSKKQHKLLPASYKDFLPLSEITIAEAMKEAGYSTFFAGKWHLGDEEKYWPLHQGFDINKGGYSAGRPYRGDKYFSPYGNPRLEDGPEGEHLPDRLAKETNEFISANKENPFFAYFSFYSVHTPLMGRKDLVEKYEEKRKRLGLIDKFSSEGKSKVRTIQSHVIYAAMVEAMDQAVGQVIRKLKEEGIYDNTIIIFFSDNGGLSTSEGHPTSNLPLRAGKGWLYEGGIREPLMIRWPGNTSEVKVIEEPVISTDLYPTILQLAGLPLMPGQHKDGESLVPLLKGRELEREYLYWHYPHYGNQGGAPGSAIRYENWKLIRWYEDDREELFNLGVDIGEKKNVLENNPEIAEKLRHELDNWLIDQNAWMPTINPYYDKEIN